MSETLLVNLGSTRAAWRGPGGNGTDVHDGRPGELLASRLAAARPRRVVVGSVARAAVNEELRSGVSRAWRLEPEFLEAAGESHGVRNGYRDPARLGVDRWAAIVAAFHAAGGPLLVVDCGTALTLDYVDAEGMHHGGLIAPGLAAMRAALAHTTRLPGEVLSGPVPGGSDWGRDTAEAVAGGCMGAVVGLIERARARVGAPDAAAASRLWITGGDAEAVITHLPASWRHVPGLVLDGLALLGGVAE